MILRVAHKAVNAAVTIVGINPGKAIPVIIGLVESRVFLINMLQVAHIVLEILVQVFLCQMPVQADFFIPLMKLAEILAHE